MWIIPKYIEEQIQDFKLRDRLECKEKKKKKDKSKFYKLATWAIF